MMTRKHRRCSTEVHYSLDLAQHLPGRHTLLKMQRLRSGSSEHTSIEVFMRLW